MKPRFEPDVDSGLMPTPPVRLVDPEAYDASEQRFAASIEEKSAPPRFVLDVAQESSGNLKAAGFPQPGDGDEPGLEPDESAAHSAATKMEIAAPSLTLQPEMLEPQDSGSWRNEVAARVNNYRARRRPRVPRYPSLQLKFDPPEPSWPALRATRTT